ncbi:MAG: DUF2179 domain-containing protein [Proteobacteria bacterium]|nr:DUF2179 domain-containing protein [Pseudomonadota bacterium]MBU1741260.1 DUF2179 domain-containing protein [Pseudomonadota bacterium]
MELGLTWPTILLGFGIFFARIADVSMGTLRTISIVHGRTTLSFFLGLIEISLWLAVISAVLQRIMVEPILAVFFALGFSTGNVVGIKLERRLAMGHIVLRVLSRRWGQQMATRLRDEGFAVTTFHGRGRSGPVTEVYLVCRRKDLKKVIPLVNSIDPESFYITEQAGSVSKVFRPVMQSLTGWRAIMKKK